MVVNSINFWLFFAATLLPYFLLYKSGSKWQNLWLLFVSYFFYGWADWRMLPLLAVTTLIFYGLGIAIGSNTESNPKDPGECHGYINRETGEWYQTSLPVINKMMEIMNDDSIVWGSEGKMPTFDHKDLSTGKVFLEDASIDVELEKTYGNSTPGKEISWDELKGKEVAIKYTGDTPVLAVSDAKYDHWSEMSAYTVDEENGIAYYLVDQQVPKAYSDDLSTINHMQARTPGKTNIEKIVILEAPDVTLDIEVDKTKKTQIDFSNAQAGDNLIIKIKGEPMTETNGCVGFNSDGWQKIEWEGKTDANGNLTISIPVSKFPAGLQSAEAQIWYQPELVDFDGYNFGQAPVETTTTTTTATTTTTTETSTTVSETTSTTGGLDYTIAGDVNGDGNVTVADAVAILQFIGNKDKYQLDAQGKKNADVDGVHGVTPNDALTILKVDASIYKLAQLPIKTE